ncbi:LAS1 [[Candida] subhashii]|uniref:LAS1 n=1 Tax=[Candida] subhashii TaxID=561895 RepID=A0A8J5QMS2_9ASCO|nr:LAS1 [[Candida] subhashii]KAG7665877.1 LAS1 [[Candida] subhashii]
MNTDNQPPMNKHPTITPYRSIDDLKQVKDWFYNFSPDRDNRQRAISKVKAWSSRGRIPHGIESTSLLTSTILTDTTNVDAHVLQLSYCMALIRFVNGILDPLQQGNYAIPLHHLAKSIGLPGFFVELRHMGTHEGLPSLSMLRIASRHALNWLYDNYWSHIEDEIYDDEEEDEEEMSESDLAVVSRIVKLIQKSIEKYDIYNNLKTFKKIRKSNLDVVYKRGDKSSEIAVKYGKCLNQLRDFVSQESSDELKEMGLSYPELLIRLLIHKKYLIYNQDKLKDKKTKFNPLIIKLYRPLIDDLGFEFKVTCFRVIHNILNPPEQNPIELKVYQNLEFDEIDHPDEIVQLLEWFGFFIEELLTSKGSSDYKFHIYNVEINNRNSLLELIINKLQILYETVDEKTKSTFNNIISKILTLITTNKNFKNLYNQENKSRLEEWYKSICNLEEMKKTYELPPSIDDLLGLSVSPSPASSIKREIDDGESAPLPDKKQKTSSTQPKEVIHYLFKPHEVWQPTSFGNFI